MAMGLRHRFQLSHTAFSVGFCVLLYTICNAINVDRLAKWFYQGERLDLWALTAYLVAGLCLFLAFFMLLAHRRTIKPAAIVITILSAPVTYFIAKYNVAIDSSMVMNTIHTDTTEVGQLLSTQMIPYIACLMVLPVLAIVSIDVSFQAAGKYLIGSLKVFALALGVAIAALYANYNAIHRAGNISNKYIVYSLVPINVLSSTINVASKSLKPLFESDEKDIEVAGKISVPGDLVVVLAVGEASRRKNFSLYGYERRNTNPVLQKAGDLHLLNAIARRGTTLYALPEILQKDDVKLTSVVAKMGIPTSCFVNYTLYENCVFPGETKVSDCGHGGKCYDEDVLPLLKNALAEYRSGYRFVVLHLGGGSHGPTYADRHPPEFQQFKPMCNDADVANRCTLEQIYNSYDNTILYVDYVVGEIVQQLDRSKVPYVFMYLSDHGESLMEEGRMFHGMPPGMTLPSEQADIPLIVKSSIPISVVERAEYTQPDVFDTVLDLFSIETQRFEKHGSFIKKRDEPVSHSQAVVIPSLAGMHKP